MADQFYLGKYYDNAQNKVLDQPLLYDPADLTTHAVVTGMTGSGKTGLCIGLLEEAALHGIPALLIDPKGDLTNLLLHFPDLAPQDFQPWLDPEITRHAGESMEQAAARTASTWQSGLAEWGIDHERMLALKNAAQFAVYTPGSDAGLPVSVLTSLQAPGLDWAGNREILTERIASTVTALLGLVGIDNVDPLRSREHILLSNIFEAAWSQNRSLDLSELILQVQTPPFEKLGAFPVDAFFPMKERMALALQVNNILAAPSFELWRTGLPLDIPALLRAPDGRPRHSVFYLAHLSDSERMFFVTLLLTAVETWMRTQPGATSLRAIVYMDEIVGYLPPLYNPSSKEPLLRLLKQARAFGMGLVLATQNPVDVDYKALSNAGTWFIGKLQTDQDKQRLLDGLEGAAAGSLDRATYDKLISGLGKRVFLMHNVHEQKPVVFQTRWTMNFLAGPMTRTQLPALNKLVGADLLLQAGAPVVDVQSASLSQGPAAVVPPLPAPTPVAPAAGAPPAFPTAGSQTRPPVPAGIPEYFLPMNLSLPEAFTSAGQAMPAEAAQAGVLYRPVLLASAQVRYLNRKYSLDTQQVRSVLVVKPDRRGVIRWDDFTRAVPDEKAMDPGPAPQARFAELDLPLSDAHLMTSLQKDFVEWVFRTSKLTLRANETFGLYATPEVPQSEFIKACAEAARQAREADLAKGTAGLDRQIAVLKEKIAREERGLSQDQTELDERKKEELVTGAETVFSLLGGRRSRRISTTISKHRMTEEAKGHLQSASAGLEEDKQQLAQLEQARTQALDQSSGKWGEAVNAITQIPITPKKTDIFLSLFGMAWMPSYLVAVGSQTVELPACH